MRTTTRLLAAALAVLAITSCSAVEMSGDDAAGTTSTADAPRPAPSDDAPDSAFPAAEPAEDADAEVEAPADGDVRTIADSAPTGQKVIRTAELVLESSDTSEALARVRAVAERAGGYTATSDLQRSDEGVVRGVVTLRVPTDTLNAVVDQLEELGDAVPVNRIDERDVTTEHADLQARIENLSNYEVELRALLAEVREATARPDDLLHIFERIRQVREEIDLLEGRLASLSDRVAYATVTVTLRPIDEDGPGTQEASPWAPGETFREALAATGRLLATIADGLIWFTVTGIPVLVSVIALPALAIYLVVRWVSRRRPRAAADEPPAAPSGPEAPSSTPAG